MVSPAAWTSARSPAPHHSLVPAWWPRLTTIWGIDFYFYNSLTTNYFLNDQLTDLGFKIIVYGFFPSTLYTLLWWDLFSCWSSLIHSCRKQLWRLPLTTYLFTTQIIIKCFSEMCNSLKVESWATFDLDPVVKSLKSVVWISGLPMHNVGFGIQIFKERYYIRVWIRGMHSMVSLGSYVRTWFYLNLICPFKSYPIECLVVWMFEHSIKLRIGFGIWLEYSE